MIIAVDFDGILCKNEFPRIGAPNYNIISLTRQLIDKGHEVILWTSRAGAELESAIKWCHDYGLHFTAINDNAPSNKRKWERIYPEGTRKVYADIYIDDHNIEYRYLDHNEHCGIELIEITLKEGLATWQTEES